MANRIALRSRKIACAVGKSLKAGVILLSGETIASVLPYSSVLSTQPIPPAYTLHDLGDLVVFPGLVDIDVDIARGLLSEHSLKALQGGTCVLAMGVIPEGEQTYTDCVLIEKCGVERVGKRLETAERLVVRPLEVVKRCEELDDYSVYTEGSSPETSSQSPQAKHVPRALSNAHIVPFSLSSEEMQSAALIRKQRISISTVFQQLGTGRYPLNQYVMSKDTTKPQFSLSQHPAESLEMDFSAFRQHSQRYSEARERANIGAICRLASEFPRTSVLICPISSPSVLPQTYPSNISFGTAVPFLTFSYPDRVKPEDSTWKCVPPIRDSTTRDSLQAWTLTALPTVASFHQSQHLSLKYFCPFPKAADGLMTLGLSLQAIWTSLKGKKEKSEERVLQILADCLATRPAEWLGLQRGRLGAGFLADILIWDPWTAAEVPNSPLSPYTGMQLFGRVYEVYLRGALVYSHTGTALIKGCVAS